MLTDEQRRELLAAARQAVCAATLGDTVDDENAVDGPPDASGVFVTLKRRGQLRGCLGTLDPRSALTVEVRRAAADSARRDTRFPPVTANEFPDLSIEVSVLGPLEPIDPRDTDAIVIGRHGLVVEDGPRRGLLLPQVATEWGWTVEQFLRQACRKAHLPEEAWRRGARVFRFEADVFGD